MSENNAISSRTTRLNSIIMNRPESLSKTQKEICEGISREGLLDALFVLYNECNKDVMKKKSSHIVEFVNKYRTIVKETKSLRVNITDFKVKTLIGSGYFGEVHLVSDNYTKDIYAMKKIKKAAVNTFQVKEERDIMVLGRKAEWITTLQYAFQDKEHLYLVMEYLPGGDLLNLMIRTGAFDEELAKFYLAELTLALNALHIMGYVHRDVKPENILLDRFGHLKLADFGNAIALNEEGNFTDISPVGTPEYVAPELLQILSTTKASCTIRKLDASCDFWSMGIIGYEMVTERTPFQSENVFDTYSEIQNYAEEKRLGGKVEFPPNLKLSRNFKDLLNGLIAKPSHRFNYDEIVEHAFFNGINFHNLRDQTPPIIPTLCGEDDTSNFEDVDKSLKRSPMLKKTTFAPIKVNDFSGEDLPFLGYTYVYEEMSKFLRNKTSEVVLESKLGNKISDLQITIKEQMREIKELQRDLLSAEKKSVQMNSLDKIYNETKCEVENTKDQLKSKIAELAAARTEVKTLKSSLKVEEEMRVKNDASISEVLGMTYQKWEKAKKLSDLHFEKQITEKKSEIVNLVEKIHERDIELTAKIEECDHLQSTVEKYKDMLRHSKEQNLVDKTDYADNRKQISSSFESKIIELKQKLKIEKEQRTKYSDDLKDLRKQLDEAIHSKTTLIEAKEQADRQVIELKFQLQQMVDENKSLGKDKVEAESNNEQLNRKNDQLRKDILKLQEENLKKNIRLSKMVSSPITIGGRHSSCGEVDDFKSAHGSMTELDSCGLMEEQLRSELARTKDNENIQKKRAESLEQNIVRLEEIIAKYNKTNEHTAEGLLERQNEKLEDQLAAAREQAILDRQSARTANLSLWKLEKELNDLKHEKSSMTRRVEMADEKVNKAKNDKESAEMKLQQQLDLTNMKETQIIDLQKEIRTFKYELKAERDKWSNFERERLREKTEIIEGKSKIKNLEEKLLDSNKKNSEIDRKLNQLVNDKDRLERRLNDEMQQSSSAQEQIGELSQELDMVTKNFEMLKEACTITENQLNELEDMWNGEVKRNKENHVKFDELWSKLRSKEEDISKLKKELAQEKNLKQSSESKGCQLQNEADEMKEELQGVQKVMQDLQTKLGEKTDILFKTQELIEITNSDINHLMQMKGSYEKELIILKEENSKVLTDLYHTKEEVKQLSNELKDARTDIHELGMEKDHLEGFLAELRTHSRERDIKSEATLAQHKKLIDYLTVRNEELAQQKKKKTLADVLFGTNNTPAPPTPKSTFSTMKKENIPPTSTNGSDDNKIKKMQRDLEKERNRNDKLKADLMKTKLEIRKSNGEPTSPRSPKSPKSSKSPKPSAPPVTEEKTIHATVHQQPEYQTQSAGRQRQSSEEPASKKAHIFTMTIETASPAPNAPLTKCLACDRVVLAGQPFWQCRECKMSVHRKCRSAVKSMCSINDVASSEGSAKTATTLSFKDAISSRKINLDDVDGIAALPDDSDTDSISSLEKYHGEHILNSSRIGFGWTFSNKLVINAVFELTEKIILLGCSNGLYSYHVEDNEIVHIKGIASVEYFAIKPNLTKSILIGDEGKNLYECDLRMLTNKSTVSTVLDPKLNIQPIDLSCISMSSQGTEKWHMVRLHGQTENLKDAVAIAATSQRLVILKYDTKLGRFRPLRALDTPQSISDVLFTQHTAIVSCDKFFEIDLSSLNAEEFLDMSDQSLRPTCSWQPMSIFRINSLEFLLCFKEFGVFVDEYGLRSRPENLNWIHVPLEFCYKNYLLYIVHEEMVQILRINNTFTKHERDLQTDNNQSRTFMVMHGNPIKFTHNVMTSQYCVNIIKTIGEDEQTQDIVKIDAQRAFKLTLNRSMTSIISANSDTSEATVASTASTCDTIN